MYYIGLDIHKKNTQACVMNEKGKIIVNERFLSEIVAINAFLDRLGFVEAKVVMEATGFYQYIYETIEARGYDVVLAHPLKLKALTTGRAKTDRNDAEMLAELLRIDAVPASYVPSKEIRELRDLTRHRSSLIAGLSSREGKGIARFPAKLHVRTFSPVAVVPARVRYESRVSSPFRGVQTMMDCLAAGVCPKCRVVNATDLRGSKRGFVPKDGAVNITCAECDHKVTPKSSEVSYWRAK